MDPFSPGFDGPPYGGGTEQDHRVRRSTQRPMTVRFWAGATALLVWCVAARSARAEDPAVGRLEAEQIVHLLDYVASDYRAALAGDGRPNELELAEQLDMLSEAARHAAKLRPPNPTSDALFAAACIQRIRLLVEARRPAPEVEAEARQAHRQVSALYDLVEVPAQTPSRERGAELYEQHCSSCHGPDGRADTARAAEYTPRPANLRNPDVSRNLSPLRVFTTLRFGVLRTAMAPFDFFSDAEKWDVAFYVSALDHVAPSMAARSARVFSLAELARETDAELRSDLEHAGFSADGIEPALADLRARAPYDPETRQPKGVSRLVLHGRAELHKVSSLLVREEREEARISLLRAYLDDVEPLETPLRAIDPALVLDIENRFKELRREITEGVPRADLERELQSLAAQVSRAGRKLDDASAAPSFATTMLSSAGVALREGVEAALLIAALLAVVGRAGAPERKRWVHAGWITAVVAGTGTWFASRQFLEMSGLGRELVEGISALLAASVLFYVSYWLFAKREAARWVSYLRLKASSGATFSLFGIAFLAVYREAFETVIFYQALVAEPGSSSAAGLGALLGAAALVAIVVVYGRTGKFAPPQSFFAFSSLLLYALAVVFAGQGISALQTTGHLPFHPVRLPHLPALGVYSTVETYAVQVTLVVLAIGAAILLRSHRATPAPPGPGRDGMAGSREGAKL